MRSAQTSGVLRFIRHLSETDRSRKLADQALLERFTTHQSEAAFAALVHRHGPMVFRLCRRILQNESDTEDAFQATFLVLSQKAASVRPSASLAGWLYGVAYRIAQQARIGRARHRKYEGGANKKEVVDPLVQITLAEAHDILDRELARLPDKLRVPLVLCYLEGLTGDEAAHQLGWSASTLKSRLEQARERLRRRLSARGLGLSGVLVASLFYETKASGAVPSALLISTVKAATTVAAGGAVASVVSTKVAALTQGAVKLMLIKKLLVAGLVAVTAMFAFGTAIYTQGVLADKPPSVQKPESKPDGGLPGGRNAAPRRTDTENLQGAWKVARSVVNGEEVGEDPKAGAVRMYFQGDQVYEMDGDLFREVHTFTLDPKQEPATIDLTSDRQGTVKAIYRFKDNALTLCRPIRPSGERPTTFASAADSNLILLVLKRDPKAPKLDLEKVKAEQTARVDRKPVVQSLMRIVGAMIGYHNDKGSFPPAAIFDGEEKPLLSWRVALLPYLGEKDLYQEFNLNEPWDSANNKKLLAKMPQIYGDAGSETAYQVIVGPDTPFNGTKAADIADGAENTILVASAAQSVPWTKPAELSYLAGEPLPKFGGPFKEGFHVVAADGAARFVPTNFNEKALRAVITAAGGERESFVDLLRADAKDQKKGASPLEDPKGKKRGLEKEKAEKEKAEKEKGTSDAAEKHKLVRFKETQVSEATDTSFIPRAEQTSTVYSDLKAPRFRREYRVLGYLCLEIQDDVNGRHIMTNPREQTATLLIRNAKNKNMSFLDNLKKLQERKETTSTIDKLDGREVVKYSLKEGDNTTTLWIDPKTKLPIRTEYEMVNPTPDIKLNKYTSTDFEWDPDLKEVRNLDELFSTELPRGYAIQKIDKTGEDKK